MLYEVITHPHRVEELEDIGPQGRPPGGSAPDPEQPQPVLERTEHQVVGQPVLEQKNRRRLLLAEDGVGIFVSHGRNNFV